MEEDTDAPKPQEGADAGGQGEPEAGAEQPTPAEEPAAAKQPTAAEPAGETEQPEVTKDAKNIAVLCHLLAIFTGFLGPLIVWLVKKDDHPFINEQGKEALNFQITVAIAMIISGLLMAVCIGVLLFAAVWVVDLVFCIIACVKVSKGEHYRYPVAIRFIK